jgi:hypothetical protein
MPCAAGKLDVWEPLAKMVVNRPDEFAGPDNEHRRVASVARCGQVLGRDGRDLLAQITRNGLYDAPEERHFRSALEQAEFGSDLTRADLEALGFHACDVNLEDELTRALGSAGMEELLEAQ